MFAKEGSIIPTQNSADSTDVLDDTCINLKVYSNTQETMSSFELYEDDGKTYAYEKGAYATTNITTQKTDSAVRVNIGAINGDYTGKVQERQWGAQVKVEGAAYAVERNGKALTQVNTLADLQAGSAVCCFDAVTGMVHVNTAKMTTEVAQELAIKLARLDEQKIAYVTAAPDQHTVGNEQVVSVAVGSYKVKVLLLDTD